MHDTLGRIESTTTEDKEVKFNYEEGQTVTVVGITYAYLLRGTLRRPQGSRDRP